MNNSQTDTSPKLECFTAQSGIVSALVRFDENTINHLHSIVQPEIEYTYYEPFEFWGSCIVLLGTGLGYHLISHASRIPPTSKVIIIEYYRELAEFSAGHLFSQIGGNVTIVSSDNKDQVERIANELPGEISLQIIKHPASFNANRSFYEELIDVLTKRKQKRASLCNGSEKRVLIYSDCFFGELELQRAIENTGNVAIPFPYKKFENEYSMENALSRSIQEDKPDLVISINMKGFDGSGVVAELTHRFGIPVAIWFVDDPYPILLHQSQFLEKNMVAFSWERSYLPYLLRCFGNSHYLPLATDLGLFQRKQCEASIPVGFVGSAMNGGFLQSIREKFLWSEALEPIVFKISEKLLTNLQSPIRDIIQEQLEIDKVELPFNDVRNFTWFCSYIIHTASMLKRKSIVTSLIPDDIEVFGDEAGWRELVELPLIVHPDVLYTSLSSVYQSIAININSTSCQMKSAVNQRMFDIPACGSFVLTDKQDDLFQLFDPGEVVTYDSTEELTDKVQFYLTNESERRSISSKAYERICNYHTYKHRLQTILTTVFGSI